MAKDKQTEFRRKCERVAVERNLYEPLFVDDPRSDCEFEDDGSLHIVRHGLRAVFDVSRGQEATGEEQNRKTRAVMKALGMERKISDSVLVEKEDEEEDEYCPTCGQRLA